ncbi:hypothetical protein JB92DRAFT_3104337 [Gautieria morchelliformis]|nr:hypothetical protein JB92DRAFT_3104337 [Gautieria morchelliformis]
MPLSRHIFELPESSDKEPPGGPGNSRRIHVDEEYMSHRHNEACINDLQHEIKQLTRKLTTLANDGGTHSTQSKSEDKRETPATRQIKRLGAYRPKDRFMPGLDAKCQGEHAYLLAVFPEDYHHLFKEKFLQQTNDQIFHPAFDLDLALGFLISPLNRWTQSDDGTTHYAPFCPILYHEYAGHQNINTIFLHQSLLDIFLVIIRGPGALDCTGNVKKGGCATMDAIWGLTEITPGAIATSAILLALHCPKTQPFRDKKWNAYFFPKVAKDTATIKAPAESINSAFTALEGEGEGEEEIDGNTDTISIRGQGLSETEPQPTFPVHPSQDSSATQSKMQASGSDILPSLADHQGLDASESRGRGRGIAKGLRKGSGKI